VCGPNFIGAAGPMIHCLLTWMLLILAPEAVEGRFQPVWRLGGVADPLGAASPPLSRVMNYLRLVTLKMVLE
jgi:hypothetical protein